MLKISKNQKAVLDEATLTEDTEWLSREVRSRLSSSDVLISKADFSRAARATITRGRPHGITGKRDLALWLEISISVVGHAFDTDPLFPQFGRVLARRNGLFVHPTVRVEECHRMLDEYCQRLFATSVHKERALNFVKDHVFEPSHLQRPALPSHELLATIARQFPEKFELHPVPDIEAQARTTIQRLANQGVPLSRLTSEIAIMSFLLGSQWFADPIASADAGALSASDALLPFLNRAKIAIAERELRVVASAGWS